MEKPQHGVEIRKPYVSYPRFHTDCGGVQLTKQAMQAECDVNKIMSKYEKTGMLTHVNKFPGNYGDFTEATDYHTSLLQVMEAQEAFDALPATVRSRFQNNPGKFLEFAENPDNLDQMVEMGLATAVEAAPEPKPAEKPPEPKLNKVAEGEST